MVPTRRWFGLLASSVMIAGCDNLGGLARDPVIGRWQEGDGTTWEFLSDGSVTTSSSFANGGSWAALGDARYRITMNVMLAGNVIMTGRIAGNTLTLEFRGSTTTLTRAQ